MKRKLNCILLIDDDEPTNFLNRMLIEEVDCTEHIQISQSGRAALDYLTGSGLFASPKGQFPSPELIFLDINMPAMNGWEFLDRYNELGSEIKRKIIIVMLTTSFNPDDITRAKENAVISNFETKPLTSHKLNRILKKYFSSYFLEAQEKIQDWSVISKLFL